MEEPVLGPIQTAGADHECADCYDPIEAGDLIRIRRWPSANILEYVHLRHLAG